VFLKLQQEQRGYSKIRANEREKIIGRHDLNRRHRNHFQPSILMDHNNEASFPSEQTSCTIRDEHLRKGAKVNEEQSQ